MKFEELDINKWEDFESKSIDITPFDKFSWKKIWVNNFDKNYNYQLAYNQNFFIPIKILKDHATFIGDKDVVDYNNLLSKNNNIDDFLDLLNKIFQTKISKLSLYSISEDSDFFSNFRNSELENLYNVNIEEEDVLSFFVPTAITHSFLELQTPAFSWKFLWSIPANDEKKLYILKNKMAAKN